MDHILNAPVYAQRTFEYNSTIHLAASYFMAFIVKILIVLLELGFDLFTRKWHLSTVGRFWCGSFCAKAFVRFNSCAMAKQLWTEQCTITGNMTIWNTLVFSMLTGIQSLSTLFTSQTFRMPIIAERLFPFS